jgi:hypothetical protein
MNVSKMIVVGIGMLAFLLSPLQLTAQAQSEESVQSRDKQQISKKAHRGAHAKSLNKGGHGRIERHGRSHGNIHHHHGEHGYHHHGRNHGYHTGLRHYTPSRHWKYYRHAGGEYGFDGRRWYFRHDGRWYHHVQPSWYGGCRGTLILDPLFPWIYPFAFPGFYDCP